MPQETIKDVLKSINDNLYSTYDKIAEKGGIIPEGRNIINLAVAIDSIRGYEDGYKQGYTDMKLSIDMSNVAYRFNEEVTSYPSNWYRININYTDANGNIYKQLATYTSSGKINIQYTPISGAAINVFNAATVPKWQDDAYRYIYIKDGDMINDIETFRWLFNNGTFNPADDNSLLTDAVDNILQDKDGNNLEFTEV